MPNSWLSGSQIIFLIDELIKKNSLQKRADVIFFEDVHEFLPQQTRQYKKIESQVMKNLLELAWAPTSEVSLVGVFWFNQHFLTVHFCQDQATAMPVIRIWDPLSSEEYTTGIQSRLTPYIANYDCQITRHSLNIQIEDVLTSCGIYAALISVAILCDSDREPFNLRTLSVRALQMLRTWIRDRGLLVEQSSLTL